MHVSVYEKVRVRVKERGGREKEIIINQFSVQKNLLDRRNQPSYNVASCNSVLQTVTQFMSKGILSCCLRVQGDVRSSQVYGEQCAWPREYNSTT